MAEAGESQEGATYEIFHHNVDIPLTCGGSDNGKWVMHKESADRAGNKQTALFTLIIKQNGNRLSGEMSNNSFRVMDGGFDSPHWICGRRSTGLIGYLDYKGGEHTHMQLTFRDGHLVGTKKSWYDAPHKWHFDDTMDFDCTRSAE